MYRAVLLVCSIFAAIGAASPPTPPADDGPVVQLVSGAARGSWMTSRSGRRFLALRGIPFARPPVGELRFKAPQPAAPWEGVLDATKDAPMCAQKNYLVANRTIEGSEDCLYLHVYSPQLSPEKPLPVMVYIYGGGWFSGTSASWAWGPGNIMDRDVVLVTLNYRLGALGFLSTGDSAACGNMGLKDQVMALRWVQDNIASVGGDPESVTLFGQSAGGASVHMHMMSPKSRGLFHRAISQSGSAMNTWAWPKDPLSLARTQALFVGCPPDVSTVDLVDCLRQIDAKTLVDSADKFHFWADNPLTTYVPVIEQSPDCAEEGFLRENPIRIINSDDYQPVPWMQGVVQNEGLIGALPILANQKLTADLNARLDEIGPKIFQLNMSVPEDLVPAVWRNVTNFYLGPSPNLSLEDPQPLANMYSDRGFLVAFQDSALAHAVRSRNPTYLYHFAYRGIYSYAPLFSGLTEDYGVCHCDELIYIFNSPLLFSDWQEGHEDLKVVDTLSALWTNFATHGDPTPPCQRVNNTACSPTPQKVVWRPIAPLSKHREYHLEYLNIGRDHSGSLALSMQHDLHRQRIAFWKSLPLQENSYGPH